MRLHWKQIHASGLVWIFWIFCSQKHTQKKHNMVQILQRVDAEKEQKVHEIDREVYASVSFFYTWLDKVVEIKQESGQSTTHTNWGRNKRLGRCDNRISLKAYLTKGKLLYKLKSVKPLSKEQAKQKVQNTGECTICLLKFQNFHGGTPIPSFMGGGPPPSHPLPHSATPHMAVVCFTLGIPHLLLGHSHPWCSWLR